MKIQSLKKIHVLLSVAIVIFLFSCSQYLNQNDEDLNDSSPYDVEIKRKAYLNGLNSINPENPSRISIAEPPKIISIENSNSPIIEVDNDSSSRHSKDKNKSNESSNQENLVNIKNELDITISQNNESHNLIASTELINKVNDVKKVGQLDFDEKKDRESDCLKEESSNNILLTAFKYISKSENYFLFLSFLFSLALIILWVKLKILWKLQFTP